MPARPTLPDPDAPSTTAAAPVGPAPLGGPQEIAARAATLPADTRPGATRPAGDLPTTGLSATDLPATTPVAGLAAARRREIALLTRYAHTQPFGLLAPARVGVSGGSSVHVDGVDASGTLYVEAHAYEGPLDQSQTTLVIQDLFKLALVARTRPGARPVLLLAGSEAAESVRRLLVAMPSLRPVQIVVVA